MFERFKNDVREPPNTRVLANSHIAQKVVQYVKTLHLMYTNLVKPKSMYLEDLVLLLEDQEVEGGGMPGTMTAETHFDILMEGVLWVRRLLRLHLNLLMYGVIHAGLTAVVTWSL